MSGGSLGGGLGGEEGDLEVEVVEAVCVWVFLIYLMGELEWNERKKEGKRETIREILFKLDGVIWN